MIRIQRAHARDLEERAHSLAEDVREIRRMTDEAETTPTPLPTSRQTRSRRPTVRYPSPPTVRNPSPPVVRNPSPWLSEIHPLLPLETFPPPH